METPFLDMQGVTKRFPGVVALDSVDLQVFRGEVLGLIGENGAGKSTLMKILGGVHACDAGQIFIESSPASIQSVADAKALGIAFIHQELNVLTNLDVAGNIFLGREPTSAGPLNLIDRRRMRREARPYLRKLDLDVDPNTPLKNLSLAQQQMVEIAKALSQNARLLIMDEPTSSLTLRETQRLMETIAELKRQGVSVIYISHRLGEIKECADRVVGLRDGKNAGVLSREQIGHDAMVRLMVGRDIDLSSNRGKTIAQPGGLDVREVVTRARPRQRVSFTAHPGEILGFAGLVGAGRTELAQAIFGVVPPLSGQISLNGRELVIRSPRDAIAAGIYLVPEDRRATGLLVEMPIRANITLPGISNYAPMNLIRRRLEKKAAMEQVQALRIKTPGVEVKARNLSGGNQQKVVLAKWLALKPRVLVVDEPTRGIDVGSKAEIYRLLRGLADSGVVIIAISSDMEEVLGISDRIAVMHEGEITGVLSRDHFSEEAVMNLAVGTQAA